MELLFQDKGLAEFWKLLEKHVKNAIYFSLQKVDEDVISIGQSKVGGLPDLPDDVEWFTFKDRPMYFLAQINLEEIKPFDIDHKLPTSGLLYFFYDGETWGFDPADKGSCKVFFYKGKSDSLKRRVAPLDSGDEFVFGSCQLQFKAAANIPDWESDLMELEKIEFSEEERDCYYELRKEMNDGITTNNKLLGHSDNIQSGMELECQLVTHGLYCGDTSGYKNPKARELKKTIDEWSLLLQIDSNDEAYMMWGDCGQLYFWIRNADLQNENFENCWLILQCS